MTIARARAGMDFQFQPEKITLMVEDHVERMMKAAFEVRCGDRTFKIYASGKTEGFDEFGDPIVINRIPLLTRT